MVSRDIFHLFVFWLLSKCRESNKLIRPSSSSDSSFSGSMDMMDLSLNHLARRYVYVRIDNGAFFLSGLLNLPNTNAHNLHRYLLLQLSRAFFTVRGVASH